MSEYRILTAQPTGTASIREARLLEPWTGSTPKDTPQGVAYGSSQPAAADRVPWHRWYNTTYGQWFTLDPDRDIWLSDLTRHFTFWTPWNLQQQATANFTFSGLPVDGNTIRIGTFTYTWRAAPSSENEIQIFGTIEDCLEAVLRTVMRGAPSYDDTGGTLVCSVPTLPHSSVRCKKQSSTVLNVWAYRNGAAGNATALSVTGTYGAWTDSGGSATSFLADGGGPDKYSWGDYLYIPESIYASNSKKLYLGDNAGGENVHIVGFSSWTPTVHNDGGTPRRADIDLLINASSNVITCWDSGALGKQSSTLDIAVQPTDSVEATVAGSTGNTAEWYQGARVTFDYKLSIATI